MGIVSGGKEGEYVCLVHHSVSRYSLTIICGVMPMRLPLGPTKGDLDIQLVIFWTENQCS